MTSTFVIIIPGFARDEYDTTCIPLSQSFIKAVNRIYPELEVIIITLDHPSTTKPYSWFGNKVMPLNGTKSFVRPLLWINLYQLLKRLSKEKSLLGILNFWCADNALVTHYFARRNVIKYFTWLQGQDARASNKILSLFNPDPQTLVALSDALKEEFKRSHGITPAHVIYPGVDPLLFKENPQKDIDIIGVGSLTPLKQYHTFIEVVEQLKKSIPAIRALIVGKGPEESRLQQMIIEKGMENNISLAGEKDHETVIQLMSQSKILLHPSSYEGYGVVCLEALAAGCDVVSFTSPEAQQVARWQIAGNTTDMHEKCRKLLQSQTKKLSAVMPRTIDVTAKSIMKLYDQ